MKKPKKINPNSFLIVKNEVKCLGWCNKTFLTEIKFQRYCPACKNKKESRKVHHVNKQY
jgi:hypothetical protein